MESNIPAYLPSIGRLLGVASTATTTLSERRLRPHGMTVRQWIVLTAVWRQPGVGESELAAYCHTSPSALNRLLDRMAEKDLIARYEDPGDARRALIHLGRVGKRKANLLDFYEEINEVLLRGFSKEEAKQAVEFLKRMEVNVSAALEEDAS